MKNNRHAITAGTGILLAIGMSHAAYAGCTDNLSSDRELNIRSGPSTNYEPVGRIPGNACGVRIRNCDDGWCRVSYRGVDGFSSEFYLRRTEHADRGRDGDRNAFEKWIDVAGDIFAKLSRDPDWERVGSLQVGRDRDRDVIQLDRRDGRFDALRMRVRGAPVDFRRVLVVYGNGQRDELDLDRTIARNSESGELELRGQRGRFIDRIVLVYQKARRRGPDAEVEVWARKTSDGRHAERPPARLGRDWERLGSKEVDRNRDRDVIHLSRQDGPLNALRLFVSDGDVRIRRMTVQYGNGVEHAVDVDRRVNAGRYSDIIELRGQGGRNVDRVVLVYDTVGRGDRAKVDVWGRTAERQGRRDRGPRLGPDWKRIGSRQVDRTQDRDEFELSKRDSNFDALRLRVMNSGVRISKMTVTYGNGVKHEVDVERRIPEGQMSDVIELRGRNGRHLDKIVLFYDTIGRRGPKAEVEVWGRDS